jgi:excisionase family DNA binding protein
MTAGHRGLGGDPPGPLVMSVAEAAGMLGISRTLAYDLVARRELPSLRLGGRIRIPRRGVERLTETRDECATEGARPAEKTPCRRTGRLPHPASGAPIEEAPRTPAQLRPSNRRHRPESTTQLSLFEPPLPVPTAASQPHTPSPDPSTTSSLPSIQPSLPATLPPLLPPSNRPDALAPGVRPGGVDVAGNGGGQASSLNGNLNEEQGSC